MPYTYHGTRKQYFASARFTFNMRADEERIIRLIQSYWQCGNIKPQKASGRGNEKPHITFHVHSLAAIEQVVIPHFLTFQLRAKKSRDFIIWKEGVEFLSVIAKTKIRGLGYGRGTIPKWTPEVREQFIAIRTRLEKQREYR